KNRENWESSLEDRNEYDRWMALGGKTMGQRANEKVKDIILNGELNTMSPEKDAAIVAILDRIDKAEKESMM
ncbi:MAG: trimethylamine methyltransferase family protein, partial [Clostridia bacterium]|nr:trimethylamine methyltransferase family protein [Clostridia bacterium]